MNKLTVLLLFLFIGGESTLSGMSDLNHLDQGKTDHARLGQLVKRCFKVGFFTFMATGIATTGMNIRETMPEVQFNQLPYGPLPTITPNCSYHYSLHEREYLLSAALVDQLCTPPADPRVKDYCYITQVCQTEGKPGWEKNVAAFWALLCAGITGAGWCCL